MFGVAGNVSPLQEMANFKHKFSFKTQFEPYTKLSQKYPKIVSNFLGAVHFRQTAFFILGR